MGRRPRVWVPDFFYHVVCRGNRRDALFKEPEDYLTFFYILEKTYEQYPFEITSYCLMTNHFHLQLKSPDQSISKIMSLVNKRYATYFNIKYGLTGHLFEKRFYDKILINEKGMLDVSKYIHLNPVEAHLVVDPEDYPWSSYPLYKKHQQGRLPYVNPTPLLAYFKGTQKEKRRQYCEYVEVLNSKQIEIQCTGLNNKKIT